MILKKFKRNLQTIRQHIGNAKLCLPVKGNAYGHGLIPIAKTAVAAGVDYLGVSCLQEGALIREAGIDAPILVFGAFHEEQIPELLNYSFELSISSQHKAQLLAKKCLEMKKRCKVHLEIDTGMQRTGVQPNTAVDLLHYLFQTKMF